MIKVGKISTFKFLDRQPLVQGNKGEKESVHALWAAPISEGSHTALMTKIGRRSFKCLIDTGADRTIIKQQETPPDWPLLPGPKLLGIGGPSQSYITKNVYTWEDPDGHMGQICPLIAPTNINLLGWDILEAFDVVIATWNENNHVQIDHLTGGKHLHRLSKKHPQSWGSLQSILPLIWTGSQMIQCGLSSGPYQRRNYKLSKT